MAFTADQLEKLGYIPQPDGSFNSPGATRSYAKSKPMDTKTKTHPHGLPDPQPERPLAKTLDGRQQGKKDRQAGPCPRSPRIRLLITRYGSRLLDADNLAGGCKPLIDAVRRSGLISDDDPKSVELVFAQYQCKRGDERTEVEVYEREGDA